MRLGTFANITYIDSFIEGERDKFPRRRQVVSILAVNPAGKAICLSMSDAAKEDGRLNVSPLQGGIERFESLSAATIRELREEVKLGIAGKVIYLGSVLRPLPPGHQKRKDFDEYFHHWVAVSAASDHLEAQPPLYSAGWYHFDTLASVSAFNMSTYKAEMFRAALRALAKRSGDSQLVRRNLFIEAPAGVLMA